MDFWVTGSRCDAKLRFSIIVFCEYATCSETALLYHKIHLNYILPCEHILAWKRVFIRILCHLGYGIPFLEIHSVLLEIIATV